MIISEEELTKLLLAILAGGLIGIEREFRDKAAGFRTNILICMGATLFTMFSLKLGKDEDPVRIAAAIVSGVGFLGAGAILQNKGRVMGLTTAATIWLTAALGMGIGGGFYEIVAVAGGAILIVLWVFPFFEYWIDNRRELRTYELRYHLNPDKVNELKQLFEEANLTLYDVKEFKRGKNVLSEWISMGSPANHDKLVAKLFTDEDIEEFSY